MKIYVFCTTSFEWFHRWPEAPEIVAYLSEKHRHMFHVKVTVAVKTKDRGVEFITLKNEVDDFISLAKIQWPERSSCEDICGYIQKELKACSYKVTSVEVSEDGENGAIVIYE